MTLIRDQISYINGDWKEGNGRPKGSIFTAENSPQYAKVQEWRKLTQQAQIRANVREIRG